MIPNVHNRSRRKHHNTVSNLYGGGGGSLTNLLFIYTCNNLNQQYHKTVQLYGIQVKMIKHLFLNLPFVCY